jgi:hypothetical protein
MAILGINFYYCSFYLIEINSVLQNSLLVQQYKNLSIYELGYLIEKTHTQLTPYSVHCANYLGLYTVPYTVYGHKNTVPIRRRHRRKPYHTEKKKSLDGTVR